MERIGNLGGAPTAFLTSGGSGFINEILDIGQEGTQVTADWLNMVQEEICNVVIGAGIALNATLRNQLLAAVRKISTPSGLVSNLAPSAGYPRGYVALPVSGGGNLILCLQAGEIPAGPDRVTVTLPTTFPNFFGGGFAQFNGVQGASGAVVPNFGVVGGTDLSTVDVYRQDLQTQRVGFWLLSWGG